MDIFLVRHGEAAAGWGESPDPGLSELGRQQAQAVARQLAPTLPAGTRLFSSPLLRARETAMPLCSALGERAQVAEAYREIPSPVALADRQAWLRQFMRESWEQQDKMLQDWRETALTHLQKLDRPAVVFTHFLVINAVVGHLTGRTETLCFWPDNGSITHLRLLDERLSLQATGAELSTRVN
tara:strand:+ start:63825 stop:64373 length:549 start_codon:yes stop_codon:yes gene_type:complete